MARMLTITIPGEPIGKPRMTRRDKWQQRKPVLRYRGWADAARAAMRCEIVFLPPTENILQLSWVAYFRPPKSWSKRRQVQAIGELHRQKPDRDNIDKALLDAWFSEDSGIAAGTIEKRWDWTPRLEVSIEVIDSPAAAEAVLPLPAAA